MVEHADSHSRLPSPKTLLKPCPDGHRDPDGLGQVEKCFGDGLAYIIDQHNTNQKPVLTAPISFGYWSF